MPVKEQLDVQSARAATALDMKLAGASYRRIAKELGVSEKTIYYDVQNELGRLDKIRARKAERLRDLEVARLEKMQLGLWPKIKEGDTAAAFALVRVMERRAKLLGLDAPEPIADNRPVNFTLTIARPPSMIDVAATPERREFLALSGSNGSNGSGDADVHE